MPAELAPPSLEHCRVEGDGLSLHVLRAGDGPPVVLLHGFPESAWSWRRQIPALADAGFGVWAPDLRGYGRSDIPHGREACRMHHIVADVEAIVRATGHRRAHIVGHDWGGLAAWSFAARYPERTARLVILNAPHPRRYAQEVRRPPQLFRSWYVFFFFLPWLPERVLAAFDHAAIRAMFTRVARRPEAFTAADLQVYVDGLARPGALTAALDYYRANIRLRTGRPSAVNPVAAETLVIWGEGDVALDRRLLDGLAALVPGVRVHRIRDASHWVQHDAAEEVNGLLRDFLTG